jgi:hypothetical protein
MQVVNSRWRRISKTSAMLTDCFMAPPAQAPTGGSPGCVSQPGLNWWLVLRGGTQSLSDDSSWSSCAVIFPRTVRGIVGEVSPFPEEGGTTTWIENHRAILAWCDRPRPLCSEPGRVPTSLLHMHTGARPLRSDNQAAHLRLYHRILNSKDGRYPQGWNLCPQTTHGCAGYTTLGRLFAHTPCRLTCRKLQHQLPQQGRLTPRQDQDALNKAIHAMTKDRPYTRPTSEMICAAPSCIRPLSQATKEPQPYVRQPELLA